MSVLVGRPFEILSGNVHIHLSLVGYLSTLFFIHSEFLLIIRISITFIQRVGGSGITLKLLLKSFSFSGENLIETVVVMS